MTLGLTVPLSPFSTVLENGTLSFTGVWDGQAESELWLMQCCGHYNHTSCTW